MARLKYKLAIFLAPALLLAAVILAPGKDDKPPASQAANSGVFLAPVKKKERADKQELKQALQRNPELSLYWQALKESGQDKQLSGRDRLTIIAPSNQALNNNRGIYDNLLTNKSQLRQTIKYTIIPQRQKRLKKGATLPTLAGLSLRVSDDGRYVGDGKITGPAVKVGGNYIYITDELTLPAGLELD